MERETKTITTPTDKREVEMYTYITGREKRAIDDVLFSKLDIKGGGTSMAAMQLEGIKGTTIAEQEQKMLDVVVVSVDGKKEKATDAVLDMRRDDYAYVLSEVKAITGDREIQEKKDS